MTYPSLSLEVNIAIKKNCYFRQLQIMHLWTNCEIYLSVTFPKCANEMVLTVLFSGPISFDVVRRGKTGKNSLVLYWADLDWSSWKAK